MLVELDHEGAKVPAVVQLTKTGQVFVFDRTNGTPLFPIEERPVPQDAVEGEVPSPTQPFSSLPPLVSHAKVTPDDAWGMTFWDRNACREQIAGLHSEGIFTPPSLAGTMMRPGYAGGSNWGGGAWDPERQLLIANVMDLPFIVALIPRAQLDDQYESGQYKGWEFGWQRGTPYGMRRTLLKSPLGAPCTAPPWGKLVAVDLVHGTIAWDPPARDVARQGAMAVLGHARRTEHGWPDDDCGGPHLSSARPPTTIFARSIPRVARSCGRCAYPPAAQATPMSYEAGGRQFVVVAAGGHAKLGTTMGDHVLAFALPAATP